ncbi:hypothetical protein [Chryseobacterium sp. 2987]|uniref:hypothetical protein n=1 Tax=Chryseobacterium sp. 2987 TaxID=2817767 RepID=UPI002860C515|nr:hypothetical protein [Chryseobacterium sp. 2987]MDR6920218.1 hypothetical protein [Chryseobacterium sp. 2987]
MKKILFLLILSGTSYHAQNIEGKETFKKQDCKEFWEKAQARFEKFKTDYRDIEKIYTKINKTALDNLIQKRSKKDLNDKNAYIYIKYLNNQAYFDEHSCNDGSTPEYNFLITKFWNKEVLEYVRKKYGKEIILSTKFPREDFKAFRDPAVIGDETSDYITQYYDPELMKIKIPGRQKSTLGLSIPVTVEFISPYLIKTGNPKTGITITYEYKNNQWELLKTETP